MEVTAQTLFNQLCDQTLQKMSATPVALFCLTREVYLVAGGSTHFWVVTCAPESMSHKLKHGHNIARLLTNGTALEHKQTSLPQALPVSFAIHMTQQNMSQTMLHMGLSGAQCFNVAGPVNIRTANKPLHTEIFLLDLNYNQKAKFIKTHKEKEYFQVMSMSKFDGMAFVDKEALLEVFYTAVHKEQYYKHLWLTLHSTLCECFLDPTSSSVQIGGHNKLRMGLRSL